ncbi:MAG: hypothetical protein N2257_07095 [Thermodesulfovibrionales bacterium]|nr:hypothetical protein [Thermodesulfovibrionales bacterium]
MPDIPDAFCIHKTAGRMRLKIPSKKGDVEYFISLSGHMATVKGIERIEFNPVTGSVLFIYDGDRGNIIRYAEEKGFFKINDNHKYPSNFHKRLTDLFQELNRHFKDMTNGEMDLAALSFIILVSFGLYQIARGNFIAPAWYTAFWYAFNILLKGKSE